MLCKGYIGIMEKKMETTVRVKGAGFQWGPFTGIVEASLGCVGYAG